MVGGTDTVPNAGRVEIWNASSCEWIAVCDDEWDFNDGQVVCRELGYPGTALTKRGSYYGDGGLTKSVGRFQCYGSKKNELLYHRPINPNISLIQIYKTLKSLFQNV